MSKYVCTVCGFVYDEALGIPEDNISPNTKWGDLPEDWVCPWCAAPKSDFEKEESEVEAKEEVYVEVEKFEGDMTTLEMSALFSNLERGFEKSYKPQEQELCKEISNYFKSKTEKVNDASVTELLSMVQNDIDNNFVNCNAIASSLKDRGALRALVWSEKVTKILKSILGRLEKDGVDSLEDSDIYVCTICGFVYVGDKLPDICPVCKVPNWKFEKVEGR